MRRLAGRPGPAGRSPIGRRLVAAEEDGRDHERPDDEQGREQDRQDEPAAPGAFQDLASRDQADAAPAVHAAAPRRLGADGLHEQFGELGWTVREPTDRRRRRERRPAASSRSTRSSTSNFTRSPSRSRKVTSARPSSQLPSEPATSTSRCRRPDAGFEGLDGAGGHDPAASDDDDVLADVLDEVELVTGEHDADARRGSFPHDLGHRGDADRVQAGERLVHDEELRVVDEGGRELDPLLVAVG